MPEQGQLQMLDDLLAKGEAQAALVLKGALTGREMELVRDAWNAGIKMGIEIEQKRSSAGETPEHG